VSTKFHNDVQEISAPSSTGSPKTFLGYIASALSVNGAGKFNYTDVREQTLTGYDTALSRFVVPEDGIYLVSYASGVYSSSATNIRYLTELIINEGNVNSLGQTKTAKPFKLGDRNTSDLGYEVSGGSVALLLSKNDVIKVSYYSASTTQAQKNENFLSIVKL
jgi:hypothetical protein